MKPVQASLKKWLEESKDFQESFAKIKQEVLANKQIQVFLAKHPELSQKTIEKNLIKLYEFTTQSYQCADCRSFGKCNNLVQGYSPVLSLANGEVHLSYEKCENHLLYKNKQEAEELFQSLAITKETEEATFDNIYNDADRSEAIRELARFSKAAETKLPERGIYLYGPFGVGKSYFLGALANKLKEYNISSMLIYMPEFVRLLREGIKDDSVNEKINYFKKADVLMLDDIGAEMQSAWFRDEVLGAILQYRMMERLPVFFTSNYSVDQLEKQLAKSTRGGVEEVKAGRIIERVRQVSKEVPVFGKNRRNK